MNGCNLVTRSHNIHPIATFNGNDLGGPLVEFINTVAQRTHFNAVYIEETEHYDIIVPGAYNENFEGSLITYPHIKGEFTWFVPSGETMPRCLGLIKAFKLEMWMPVGFTFIFGTITFWLISVFSKKKVKNAQMRPGPAVVLMDSLLSHLGMSMQCRHKGPVATNFFFLCGNFTAYIFTPYTSHH